MFMLQQRVGMNLYSFNNVSWRTGYDSTAILNRFVPLGERKYYFELLYKVCIKKK